MSWSMPQPVLRIVAGLIGFVALSAFALGVINAPMRGRLPGERLSPGAAGAVAAVAAVDATPLGEERIEGPAAAPALTPEERAEQEAEKQAQSPTDAPARQASGPAQGSTSAPTPALQTVEPTAPASEEAPH